MWASQKSRSGDSGGIAGQKGTGKWTSVNALDMGIAAPCIAEAVFARCISAVMKERVAASKIIRPRFEPFDGDRDEFVQSIHDALYGARICSYAQGFQLMREAQKEYGWSLNFGEISMIWRGGCIIRARFLQKIYEAYQRNPELANLLLDPYIKREIDRCRAEMTTSTPKCGGAGFSGYWRGNHESQG